MLPIFLTCISITGSKAVDDEMLDQLSKEVVVIDVFTDRATKSRGFAHECFQSVTNFGHRIIGELNSESLQPNFVNGRPISKGVPAASFQTHCRMGGNSRIIDHWQQQETPYMSVEYLVGYRGGGAKLISASHVAAQGDITTQGSRGFWFVNGNVAFRSPVTDDSNYRASFLLAVDGNITFEPPQKNVRNSSLYCGTVLCRGYFQTPNVLFDSKICCQGDIQLPEGCFITNTTIRAGGKIHLPKKYTIDKASKLEENCKEPFKPFRFFELKDDLGLEAEASKLQVKIKKIDEKSPLAKHLQPGDVIDYVGTNSLTSVEGFRKAMRTACINGECNITRIRNDKNEVLTVTLPELKTKKD